MSDAVPLQTLRDGRYVVIGTLGAGSQAETLDAIDKRTGHPVAIKRFQVRGAKSWKDVELAEREARVLSTLSHASLPVYLEHFEEAGALYLVMQKIEGETLAALRRRGARLSAAEVYRFLTEADATLAYLHSRVPPIIHRDIKPGNVIRRGDGSFAFVDFGSVRDQLKPEGGSTVVGTFGYMAPEQFQGRALPGSDVYAVGATALALLTGQEPENLPHRGLAIDVARALGGGTEPKLAGVLATMLDPDPDRRPARIAPLITQRASQRPEFMPRSAWDGRDPSEERGRGRTRSRREERHARRAEEQRMRDERRRHRHARRGGVHVQGFVLMAPLLVAFVFLGLLVARVATWALFRVFLPTLLSVLSVFFGRGLLQAARRCDEVGAAGERGLLYASQVVRGRLLWGRAGREPAEARPSKPPTSGSASNPRASNPASRVRVEDVHADTIEPPEAHDDASSDKRANR